MTACPQRLGCAVVGLDVAQFHIEQGRARAVQEGVGDRVSFVQGDIEALPFEDERFDFLWSPGASGYRRYEVALVNYHWALYILLGKLSPALYVLRKNASS